MDSVEGGESPPLLLYPPLGVARTCFEGKISLPFHEHEFITLKFTSGTSDSPDPRGVIPEARRGSPVPSSALSVLLLSLFGFLQNRRPGTFFPLQATFSEKPPLIPLEAPAFPALLRVLPDEPAWESLGLEASPKNLPPYSPC
jgi:hypothetical protein